MKTKRASFAKVLTAVLTAAIVLSSVLLTIPASAETETLWDGTVATGFAGGDGTEATPYLISNAAEWAYFAAQVTAGTDYSGKYVKLTADLTFNEGDASTWVTAAPAHAVPTVGTDGKPFKGTFDGQGHTLSGVYIDGGTTDGTGLFGDANGATIQNLCVTNSCVVAEDWCGILIGEVSGGITVKNVVLLTDTYLTVTRGPKGTACAGGFAGGCYGSTFSSPVKIEDSVFAGTVELTGNADSGYIGGFVGNGNTAATTKVHPIELVNCLMVGTIVSAKGKSCGFVGGNGDTKGKYGDELIKITGCVFASGAKGFSTSSVPFSDTASSGMVVSGCYSVVSGNQYKTLGAASEEGVTVIEPLILFGTDTVLTIDGWTKRADAMMVPAGAASMCPTFAFEYTITWMDDDGETVLDTETYKIGATPSFKKETPVKADTEEWTYQFNCWTPELVAVTGDTTYTATYYQKRITPPTDDPADDPTDDPADDPTEEPTDDPKPEEPKNDPKKDDAETEKSGCGSVIGTGAVCFFAVTFGGAALLGRKKKED